MVQLRSCYFCGTTGALSEYDALPPDTGVASEASPRVVLCDRCHTKLTNVLAPLVDRSSSGPAPTGDAAPTEVVGSDSLEADERPSQPEVTFARPSTPVDRTTDDPSDVGTDSADTADDSADTADDSADTADDSADHTGDGSDSDATADETVDRDDADAESERVDASDAVSETAGGPATGATEETEGAPPATDLDRVYHKLLRFLRNREFPIPRSEAEAIAQSAYDLTATEASQVIQRTLDRDVLEERDGELHRR